MINKNIDAYKTIGEITKELGLINKKDGSLQTHTIRYWEREFKQIKPFIKSGKRRYYSSKNLEIIKIVKYLLKDMGMTIKGAKKLLNTTNSKELDAYIKNSITNQSLDTGLIKDRLLNISNKIKELKKITDG